ncbi:MAG TPA: glycosyltransferase family 4 protein [Thermoanaerobaculia bacterium]|nr:glycosyltransferase family 4 protein [Thermoanaerobaculia bacterium]
MNIAVYSHYFVPEIGAPSARIHDLAREWMRAGHRVQVATCFPNHPTGRLYPGYRSAIHQCETIDGIEVHRHWSYITPNKGFLKKTVGHVSFMLSSWLSARRVKGADVIIGTSPTFFAAIAAERIAAWRKRPFVMEVRDLWPAVFVDLGVLKNKLLIRALERMELWLYKRAARVVTVTESFREDLIRRGVPAEKVKTIRNGANLEQWDASRDDGGLRKRLGLESKFVALYIGAHGISQALSAILDAAKQLRDAQDIEFVFVGEGAEKDMLVRRARDEGLTNVRFLDPVGKDEVRQFYAMADACLVPLRDIPLFDTFIPSKMFEMMAMARPVVASVRGEAAAILAESGGAIVVPPEDSAAIAHALREIARDRKAAEAMGARGRAFVAANYSRRALAAQYLEVLAEAVA